MSSQPNINDPLGAPMYEVIHSYMRQDLIICVTRCIHMSLLFSIPLDVKDINGAHTYDTDHSCVRAIHDSMRGATRCIHMSLPFNI